MRPASDFFHMQLSNSRQRKDTKSYLFYNVLVYGKLVLLNALDFLSKIAYNLNYSI